MKLTYLDLMVISDTLSGSLAINDGGALFGYTKEYRKDLRTRINQQMNSETVKIDTNDKDTDER